MFDYFSESLKKKFTANFLTTHEWESYQWSTKSDIAVLEILNVHMPPGGHMKQSASLSHGCTTCCYMSCYSMRGRDSEGKNSSILHFQSWIKTHLVLQWVFTAAAQQSRKIQNITADVNFYPEAQLWEVHQLKLIKVWTTVRRLLAEQIQ